MAPAEGLPAEDSARMSVTGGRRVAGPGTMGLRAHIIRMSRASACGDCGGWVGREGHLDGIRRKWSSDVPRLPTPSHRGHGGGGPRGPQTSCSELGAEPHVQPGLGLPWGQIGRGWLESHGRPAQSDPTGQHGAPDIPAPPPSFMKLSPKNALQTCTPSGSGPKQAPGSPCPQRPLCTPSVHLQRLARGPQFLLPTPPCCALLSGPGPWPHPKEARRRAHDRPDLSPNTQAAPLRAPRASRKGRPTDPASQHSLGSAIRAPEKAARSVMADSKWPITSKVTAGSPRMARAPTTLGAGMHLKRAWKPYLPTKSSGAGLASLAASPRTLRAKRKWGGG